MTTLLRVHRLARVGGLAWMAVLGALALSACLPLQFGFERPTAASPAATPVAQVGPPFVGSTTTTASATRTPANEVTPTASVTGALETPTSSLLSPSPTPPYTHTPTPAPPTPLSCALTHTVQPGEQLTQIGALYGVRWQDIASLNALENPGLIFAGQVLCLPPNARLPNTPTVTPTATATAPATGTPTLTSTASPTADPCLEVTPAPWFFTPAPPVCPAAAAITSQAAAQTFEHGQMLWLAALDRYFVLLDGASASTRFMTYLPGPLDLKPGASPDNRVPETPPPGLEQPVSGFGLIWRGEVVGAESVRAALGWATHSEGAFTTTHQCQASSTLEWNCYLRGPNGQVLRLYFTPGIGFFWDNW